MRRILPSRILIVLLVAAAITQAAFLGHRLRARASSHSAAPPPDLKIGDEVDTVHAIASDADTAWTHFKRSDGEWTAVLAFYSNCPYCEAVSPVWRDWLSRSHSMRVVGITRDSLPVARRYVTHHGWDIPVLSVLGAPLGSTAQLIVNRTPWVFLIDARGIVRYAGHGQTIALLDSLRSQVAVRE